MLYVEVTSFVLIRKPLTSLEGTKFSELSKSLQDTFVAASVEFASHLLEKTFLN